MKILAIQPHADDLFISLGWTLKQYIEAGAEATALTVYSNEKQRQESDNWCHSISIHHTIHLNILGSSAMDAPVPSLGHALDSYCEGYDKILCPLGIYHNEHVAVREAIRQFQPFSAIGSLLYYYVDMPYAVKQKNAIETVLAIAGKVVVNLTCPTPRKYKEAEKIFKSYSAFFFYEKDNLTRCFEMVVK